MSKRTIWIAVVAIAAVAAVVLGKRAIDGALADKDARDDASLEALTEARNVQAERGATSLDAGAPR